MKNAILGWGSLIWNPRDLPISGEWQLGGRVLPIKLTRPSASGRLTLVTADHHGAGVLSRYALSARPTVGAAVNGLHRREGCQPENGGFVEVATHRIEGRAMEQGFDALIWTPLGRRFKQRINVVFSPAAAVRCSRGLASTQRETALEFIPNAPPELITSDRRSVTHARLIPSMPV